ncbi:hypothetical protein LXA43DRAFT_521718 [Ganoderma leucocontextum]|nr:hypothetical protein LXA43DRAFT_521718 [Ganoderma leucocontextum]
MRGIHYVHLARKIFTFDREHQGPSYPPSHDSDGSPSVENVRRSGGHPTAPTPCAIVTLQERRYMQHPQSHSLIHTPQQRKVTEVQRWEDAHGLLRREACDHTYGRRWRAGRRNADAGPSSTLWRHPRNPERDRQKPRTQNGMNAKRHSRGGVKQRTDGRGPFGDFEAFEVWNVRQMTPAGRRGFNVEDQTPYVERFKPICHKSSRSCGRTSTPSSRRAPQEQRNWAHMP